MGTVPVPVAPQESVAVKERVTDVEDRSRMGDAGFEPVLMVPIGKYGMCTYNE